MRPPYFLLVLVVVMATCATVQRSAARREREARIALMKEELRRQDELAAAAARTPVRPREITPPPRDDNWERSLRMSREECENARPTEVKTATGPGGMTVQSFRDADCSKLGSRRR